jgi:hypothetical protein
MFDRIYFILYYPLALNVLFRCDLSSLKIEYVINFYDNNLELLFINRICQDIKGVWRIPWHTGR